MIKKYLVDNFPSLGKYKRYLVAARDSAKRTRTSYSQHEEDKFIWETLQQYNIEGSVYVDIGANHPTDISNTYLLYRNGLKGIIIEPNSELISLFARFRPRDTLLMIGCSNYSAVLPFHISKTPVISSFREKADVNVYKTVFVPVMRADDALSKLSFPFVSLLSIDVEGLNKEVLEGAPGIINKSLLLCVEFDSTEEKETIIRLMENDFKLLKTFGCNLIFLNQHLAIKKQKV